ncbi:MAG: glycosyltransferase family 2 protein [Spirochaetota bacterium]
MRSPGGPRNQRTAPGRGPSRASVVIPTHNRRDILSRVLCFYRAQDAPRDCFELVVADDGSTDGTPELFEQLPPAGSGSDLPDPHRGRVLEQRRGLLDPGEGLPGRPCEPAGNTRPGGVLAVRYLRLRKSGRSAARNAGVLAASHPLIVFADDDIFVEPGFISKHLEAHRSGEDLVVMGRVIHTGSLDDPLSARWKPKDINTAFLSTGNASVRRDLLIAAGLFDERYTVYGWEDFDLGIHLRELGVRSVKRDIRGYHYDPPRAGVRPREVYRKERERGLSAVYFYRSHPLPWVRRFTLVENRPLQALFDLLGRGNWFLSGEGPRRCGGLALLIIRYKGYFDGVREGMREQGH